MVEKKNGAEENNEAMSQAHRQEYFEMAKRIVLGFFQNEEYNIFVFGGRAEDPFKRMGDLDIGIWGEKPLSAKDKVELEAALERSKVPWNIDIVDFYTVSDEFKKEALSKILLWKKVNDLVSLKVT